MTLPQESASGTADLFGTPLPPPPGWGHRSIADLLPSAAACLRAVAADPQTARTLDLTDRLDLSARLERSGGNPGPYRHVCVVLVDGLGRHQLDARLGYAPTLGRAADLGTLDAALPSTTAASLAALGTGAPPGTTGMVGYDVLDPSRGVVVNQLGSWDPAVDPRTWQPHPTVFERLAEMGPRPVTVSRDKYANSPLTEAALRGACFIGTGNPLARISRAADALDTEHPTFMYLYWPELDQAGHRHGWDSPQWEQALEELDSGMRRLRSRVGEETLILLSADHGMVDVPAQDRLDYSAHAELVQGVAATAGEPRLVQLHLKAPRDQTLRQDLAAAWHEHFGQRIWILDREHLIREGYFGSAMRTGVRERIGDLLIAARESLALWDLRRVRRQAMDMVGQHGSWTSAEREIPLLAL